VQKVLDIVSTYYPLLEKVSEIIAELDVLVGFSYASTNTSNIYARPKFTEDKKISLIESRHPLIEIMDPMSCISNDCTMVKEKSNLQIITGPNMGGKSTFIRQIAISVLLAHVGCFVPCQEASMPLIDCIIARVGASDH
jgi:DNA mismatch repair protein MSH2